MPAYAELQVTTNFSFLRGASHPEELVARAKELGHTAIGVTDRNSFAGMVRAHVAAREFGLRLVPGVRLDLEDGFSLLAWPTDRPAYARLATLLSIGKRRTVKGRCRLTLDDVVAAAEGQLLAFLPPDEGVEPLLRDLAARWRGRLWLALSHLHGGDDRARITRLAAIAYRHGVPPLAVNDVHYHEPGRRRLQDVVTCIREHCRLANAGGRLFANAERHLKSPAEMARLFRDLPEALSQTQEIVRRSSFEMSDLAYDYPTPDHFDGRTPDEELARRVIARVPQCYPDGLPDKVRGLIANELELIARRRYAPYFLTIDDIVAWARGRAILHQGRGSAANSAVCYILGITAVDPTQVDLLFERFVSDERDEPPDIDVDFEHERREEVIQHVYETYGRDHAALAATVIRYRAKSAMREVAKVMGLSADVQEALTRTVWGFGREGFNIEAMRAAGLDPDDPTLRMTLELAAELIDTPRHLSQHVGGFVIARSPLHQLVPIENAAMADRTVVEWDKDDLDALRMLKIDILALGMLTAIRKSFELLRAHHGVDVDLATVPKEDARVYDMLCEADSIGVFQVESRAQMSMLPRLKPRTWYDLVIEVAIVRPGPIQGDMVHPYLRRREGREPVEYPSEKLREVLGRTMGVPLFQEQAMKIAMVAAGFSASEADGLRRSMAAFRKQGLIEQYHAKMVEGMVANDYTREFAEACFRQIEGFGYYGFPESHAASFAHLVYTSAWLKRHHPDVFCAALLNSQPMGFYAPAQLVRDAQDHGVEVRPVDVNHSDWDATLEPAAPGAAPTATGAVRLGLRLVKGLGEEPGQRIAENRPYRTIEEIRRRAKVRRAALMALAEADALRSLSLDRRQAGWTVRGLPDVPLPLFEHATAQAVPGSNLPPVDGDEPWLELPAMGLGQHVIEDYASLRLSLKAHPLGLLRPHLAGERLTTARALWDAPPGRRVTVAGLVLVRQRPGSAKGVIFATLEDETGVANVVIWSHVFERWRSIVMTARLLAVRGRLQREGRVIHVVAERLADWTPRLSVLRSLAAAPRELDGVLAPADEVRRGIRDVREAMPGGRNFR